MSSPAILICLGAETFAILCALVFGAWRERAGAGIIFIMALLNFGLRALTQSDSIWWHLPIDGLALAGFIALVWKSPHPWPMWAAGCQLFAVGLEINALLNPNIMKYSLILLSFMVYGDVLALLTGTWMAFRMRQKLG